MTRPYYDRAKPSRAVIAGTGGGPAVVIWYVGFDLEMMIDQAGLSCPSDLGLDDAPEGISIWEGVYEWVPGPYEYPLDGHHQPDGEFRDPTPDEWASIMQHKPPWNQDDWIDPKTAAEMAADDAQQEPS